MPLLEDGGMIRLAGEAVRRLGFLAAMTWFCGVAQGQALPGTTLLQDEGDLAAKMVEGIDRHLLRALGASGAERQARWQADLSSAEAYGRSLAAARQRFRTLIGAVDARAAVRAPALDASLDHSAVVARGPGYRVLAVRWQVFDGAEAQGLLVQPEGGTVARIVALPDADWTPEDLLGLTAATERAFALPLAAAGCEVLIPVLIDRQNTWSGTERFGYTNQSHREFLYRMAFEVGRHIIGYEVQQVLAAVDWFASRERDLPVGVVGYGEGGLIALYAGAVDERIDGVAVSGYFGKREALWQEPIYRNVWALLREFDDGILARMIAPRALVVEASRAPEVAGPPTPTEKRRNAAAPGRLTTPPMADVEATVATARPIFAALGVENRLVLRGDGTGSPGLATSEFLEALGGRPAAGGIRPPKLERTVDPAARMRRQFDTWVRHTQNLVAEAPFRRTEFWKEADASSLETWKRSTQRYRDYLWQEVLGKLPGATAALHARSRLSYDRPEWTGYDVVIPVFDDVFAYGVLLLPKDLKPGEKRPVVVCQHGLEGRPQFTIDPDQRRDRSVRRPWAQDLVRRGFIVYAPQNPYVGGEAFRTTVRKAYPLKLTLYSFIVAQHARTLDWLASLPFVDAQRMGFYGISYGGKTALRAPVLLDRYALSICSADFNEWLWKNTRLDFAGSYLYTAEYEMPEFNLGNTFNHGELANLMAPRPFMVERGHHDGVAIDEWVAYEYARVRRFYTVIGIPDRTEIEYFNGPHTIHGEGTYRFLHKHLKWPERSAIDSGAK
jgi:cephalosporin-C deacetylase-like acetyl esterase